MAVTVSAALLVGRIAVAHPSSGLAVTEAGQIYFVHSTVGVARVESGGKLTYVHRSRGGHWLCLDRQGAFADVQPKHFERISAAGVKPAILFADGGAPIAVCSDGNLYYGSNGGNENAPGGLTVSRISPKGEISHASDILQETLSKMDEGVTGLAAGMDVLYVATPSSLFKMSLDGKVTVVASPIKISDCDEDLPANWKRPGLRGICASTNSVIFAAATGCRRVLKISASGDAKVVAKSDTPWNPVDVAMHQDKLYFLEWTNANGGVQDGWRPRVRCLNGDGSIETIVEIKENVR